MEIQKKKLLGMTVIYRGNLKTFVNLLSRKISTTNLLFVRLQYRVLERKILKEKTCTKRNKKFFQHKLRKNRQSIENENQY
jgi:hypothetical protein